jgi:thiamine-monophosphate kinase
VTSLTDISDGLYRELKNLCDMTSTSVMIENLPVTLPFKEACQKLNQDPFITSLQGGEEYSLLWTVKPDFLQDFLKKYQIQFKKKPFLIGRVQSNKSKRQIVYENQDLIESIKPFEHFES